MLIGVLAEKQKLLLEMSKGLKSSVLLLKIEVDSMELNEALEYINFGKIGTNEQYLEALTTMFREICMVNVKNEDCTYKSIYDIFSEASKNWNNK